MLALQTALAVGQSSIRSAAQQYSEPCEHLFVKARMGCVPVSGLCGCRRSQHVEALGEAWGHTAVVH